MGEFSDHLIMADKDAEIVRLRARLDALEAERDELAVTLGGMKDLQAETIERASLHGVWQQARENHAAYSDTGSTEDDIRFFALGLVGEAGEVANFVKKRWRDGEPHSDDLRKECADVLAYTMMLADALGMTPETLVQMVAHKQQVFIEKMQARALSKEQSQ